MQQLKRSKTKSPSDRPVVGASQIWSLRRFSARQYAMVVLGLLVIAGGILLFAAGASPFASLNADKGTLANGATIQTDSSASDGKYVQFGSTSGGSGTVLWRAGAENPMDQEWAELSTQTHCAQPTFSGETDGRVSQESSNVDTGSRAYRVELDPGDDCYDYRAELGQALPRKTGFDNRLFTQGQDVWIHEAINIQNQQLLNITSWLAVTQIKHEAGCGGGPDAIEIEGGRWNFNAYSTSNDCDFTSHHYDLGPAKVNTWAHFTYHMIFSPDPSVGLIEVYADTNGGGMRQLVPPTHVPTMMYNYTSVNGTKGSLLADNMRIGIYHDPNYHSEPDVALFDSIAVATTRAAAEN